MLWALSSPIREVAADGRPLRRIGDVIGGGGGCGGIEAFDWVFGRLNFVFGRLNFGTYWWEGNRNMTALRFHRRRTRRLWMYGGLTVVLSSAVVLLIAAGAGAVLTGSSFDTSNGNLTPSAPTLHDWNPAGKPTAALNPLGPVEPITCPILGAGTNCGVDWVGNSAPDNSFTQGTKEDSEDVVVATGSIPPNKDDLSRFYINKERRNFTGCAPGTASPNTCDYLYLAWERTSNARLGTHGLRVQPGARPATCRAPRVTAGGVTILRTAGDLLVDFDFGGSGVPVGSVLSTRWIVGRTQHAVGRLRGRSTPGTNVNVLGQGQSISRPAASPEASVNSVARARLQRAGTRRRLRHCSADGRRPRAIRRRSARPSGRRGST